MPHDAASRVVDALLDVLSGPLDECRHALSKGRVADAETALTVATDQLRRIRRDLREEDGAAE
jgi:hypothetical protein